MGARRRCGPRRARPPGRSRSRWRYGLALCLSTSSFLATIPGVAGTGVAGTAVGAKVAGAGVPIGRAASAAPPPVGVIAPAGSRLAGELKRELAAARVASVSMVASDRDWPAEMTDLIALPYLQGVVVGANDGHMVVFSRAATTGRVEVRFELRFDPNDRPARRRACLAVVEGLRVLGETLPSAAPEHAEPDLPATVAPPGSVSPAATGIGAPPARAPDLAAGAPLPAAGAPAPREPWVMGVATMLDVDRSLGAPMGHLQFVWIIPIGPRFGFRVQTMWPLMGTQLRAGGVDVRVWTFGAALGLQYSFTAPRARLRPFIGLATGSQLLLTDTSAMDTEKGRSLFVPSANLRSQLGVRYAIASRVQVLAELEATRDWLIQSRRLIDYRDSVANTVSFHASLGVLFEY